MSRRFEELESVVHAPDLLAGSVLLVGIQSVDFLEALEYLGLGHRKHAEMRPPHK